MKKIFFLLILLILSINVSASFCPDRCSFNSILTCKNYLLNSNSQDYNIMTEIINNGEHDIQISNVEIIIDEVIFNNKELTHYSACLNKLGNLKCTRPTNGGPNISNNEIDINSNLAILKKGERKLLLINFDDGSNNIIAGDKIKVTISLNYQDINSSEGSIKKITGVIFSSVNGDFNYKKINKNNLSYFNLFLLYLIPILIILSISFFIFKKYYKPNLSQGLANVLFSISLIPLFLFTIIIFSFLLFFSFGYYLFIPIAIILSIFVALFIQKLKKKTKKRLIIISLLILFFNILLVSYFGILTPGGCTKPSFIDTYGFILFFIYFLIISGILSFATSKFRYSYIINCIIVWTLILLFGFLEYFIF